MAGIRLEWAQFGNFDSFDVLRSSSPMDITALPSPIATNLPTMFYVDTTVVEGATYYYRARVWRDGVGELSDETIAIATLGTIKIFSPFKTNLIDEAGKVWTAKNGATVIDNKLQLIRSSSQYVEMPYSPDFHFSAGEDVTIRAKVSASTFSVDRRVLLTTRRDEQYANNWCIYLNPNAIQFFIWTGSGSELVNLLFSGIYTFGMEFEFSLERKSMYWRLYIDGVQVGTAGLQGSDYMALSNKLTIGSECNADETDSHTRDLDGTIRDLQLIKGAALGNGGTTTSRI